MNNELIQRIDDELSTPMMPEPVRRLLRDCKAEIERLVIWPSELLDKIERLSKPYVPMDAHDWMLTMEDDYCFSYERAQKVETAVIDRYNEQRGVK